MRLTIVLLAALMLAPHFAHAQSRLWQEREANAQALADVPDFAALAKKVIPAVVAIQVEQRVEMGHQQRNWGDPFDFFFGPFGGEVPHEFRNRGLGSGFVISQKGLILTNYHVVENADTIEVSFAMPNGRERKMAAKMLGAAPEYDVALLQTNKDAGSAVAFLGDSDQVEIGDWVMAVGNPFGLSHSVSVGIISAKERRDIMPSGRRGLYDFLQTDASINPGNSGGPLINMQGEVIGINSAINAAGSGIGFAIPINMVKEMLPQLKKEGRFTRSWIGIRIQGLTAELAESYGLQSPLGALVSEVVQGSPAEQSGLEPGDVIIEFDGKLVRSSSDLPLYASMAGVGRKVAVKIWRGGHERDLSIVLAAFPASREPRAQTDVPQEGELGMVVADIDQRLRSRFNLAPDSGVVIKEVEPASVAARAGLRPGDLVLTINGKRPSDAREAATFVRKLKSGAVLRLQVERAGSRLYVALRKP